MPLRPVDVRQREIGMEAERNGHSALPRGRDDRADRERGLSEARIDADVVREGEALHVLGVGAEVELSR